jgi:SAM-dependent methyltransferase
MGDPTTEERIGRHYKGELGAQYYAWQHKGAELGAELERPKFAPYVGPRHTVVDFGCGGGFVLAGLDAGERIGIEVNDAARAAANGRGVRAVASAAELPDGCADVVISNHALEHTLAPVAELRELHRLLKPGGRLVLWLPLDDWRRERRPDPADINHHLYTWTPQLLANLLDEARFEVIETRVVTYAWPQLHDRLYRLLPRRAFDAVCVAWSFVRHRRQVMAVARPRVG